MEASMTFEVHPLFPRFEEKQFRQTFDNNLVKDL
jgi:hypothetical protein